MGIYILIGLPVFFITFLTVVARLEKRMVWPYGNPEPQLQFADTSGYGTRWVAEALGIGCTFLGWAPDLKGPRYKVSYGFLASPEGDYFVIVGVGTILNIPLRGTWIYTRSTDSSVVYTTDNQSCVEIDVLRRWRSQLRQVNTFSELLRHHKDLLQHHHISVQSFTAGREVGEFRAVREERYHAMSREGLIFFTDASATYWRYTMRGALKLAFLNYSIGLLRGITHGRVPRAA